MGNFHTCGPNEALVVSAPEPAGPWSGTYNATNGTIRCTQVLDGPIKGQEDCLFLNVYTPQLPDSRKKLLPVMVYIFGGGFAVGAARIDLYGPNFIMDHDVVLVTMNYRFGPLGFMTTGDMKAPGNFGLKDQILALRWVQDNIAAFGGNPAKVTLFGNSAGAAFVHALTLSDKAEGLFHKFILESGTATSIWAFRESSEAFKVTLGLANSFNCSTADSSAIVQCLRNQSAVSIMSYSAPVSGYAFIPTNEPASSEAVITDSPRNLTRQGKMRDLPWICGMTSDEGLLFSATYINDKSQWSNFLTALNTSIYSVTELLRGGSRRADYINAIKANYFNDLNGDKDVVRDDELCFRRGCCGSTRKRTIVGGYVFTWWFVTDVQRLSLEVMTLNPVCESVETAQGVPLTVTGVAQCKIMKADELLHTASEQFLGKSVHEIKSTILSTLEGHLRAILGTLSVEEVYKDRDQFAALVREVAAPDVGRMGIEILSFTIKDVYDDVEYLASLGKAQTAAVKRDADIGVAEANRDAGIREAECEKAAMDIKYNTDTKIEDNARLFQLQKANFDQEVNTAKAEAQLAYELQAAKIKQRLRNEEIQIDVVERRKLIEVEEQEVLRKEHELRSTVRLPAEAESYKIGKISEGKRMQTVDAAKAEAERIRLIGDAEAQAMEAIGMSEAERMRKKAAVYRNYGNAAILNIILNAMPKIAAEVAAPLARTEEIVLLGGNDATSGEITRLVGQVPPAVQALTGVDISKVLGKIPGAK